MKVFRISLVLVACLITGCTAINTDAPRVTDELRTLCYWLEDRDIEAMLNDIDEARRAETPESALEDEAAAECAASEAEDDCNACFTLAIDTVYH
jgi:hypothetical protein